MAQDDHSKQAEIDFNQAMQDITRASIKDHYFPAYFLQMLGRYGGVETAKRLLAKNDIQSGLNRLWEEGKLDQSMEAHVIKPEFQCLFTEEEIAEAQRRLDELRYNPT
jgi:hypothetical protein